MSHPAPKTVGPIITVESVGEIRSHYVETLGFNHMRGVIGKDRQLAFCIVVKDGARIVFARAPGKSAETKSAPSKQPVGGRRGRAILRASQEKEA